MRTLLAGALVVRIGTWAVTYETLSGVHEGDVGPLAVTLTGDLTVEKE